MVKCVFCGREESSYKGVNLIKNDGSTNFFCSGKCRKNAINLKRDKKKFKWTEAYGISKEKAAQQVIYKKEEAGKSAEKAKIAKEKKEAEDLRQSKDKIIKKEEIKK